MTFIACARCGRPKLVKAYRLLQGAKYCSRQCYAMAKRGWRHPMNRRVARVCRTCRREFEVKRHEALKGHGKYCSSACYPRRASASRGAAHHNWTGGRRINLAGYVEIRVDGRYRYEHRVVVERAMGRRLSRNEIVHHKNGDKQDNRLENLEVMGRGEHTRHHLPRLGTGRAAKAERSA